MLAELLAHEDFMTKRHRLTDHMVSLLKTKANLKTIADPELPAP